MSEQSEISGEDTGPVQDLGQVVAPESPAPAPTASKQVRQGSNTVAVVGLVFAVLVWPLGTILSLSGLIRSGKLGGAGRTAGIVGLVLSLLVGAGSTAFLVLNHHTPVDPGCVTAEAGVTAFRTHVTTDQAAIQNAEALDNETLLDTDIDGLVNDMITDEGVIHKAAPAATSVELQNADSAMDSDLQTVITGYQALQQGDTSQTTQTTTASSAVLTDATTIDGLCK